MKDYYYQPWQYELQEDFESGSDSNILKLAAFATERGVPAPLVATPVIGLAAAAYVPTKSLEGSWLDSPLLTTEKQRRRHYWNAMRAVLP